LTLHLARAVQAANSFPPILPPPKLSNSTSNKGTNGSQTETSSSEEEQESGHALETNRKEYDAWRSRRGAVIHSVDVSKAYSAHAETIVRGFRRGVYAGSVDFHVSHVEDWIASKIRRRQRDSQDSVEPFLSYAILDMPGAQQQLANVAPVLCIDGILAVFMPSISQIAECEAIVSDLNLRLSMERVVELGTGISGGRLWDVRYTKPRKHDPSRVTTDETVLDLSSEVDDTSSVKSSNDGRDSAKEESDAKARMVLVCRPKVGDRIVGGGFVGIWRKMKDGYH
jgi:hypothetical protein